MGFWEQTMQTVALVLSSTVIALILGVPLGIWTAQNRIAAKIIRPVMDLMRTMPAFVYLIPAVLFFGLGPVPGAFCHGDICHAAGCPFDGFRNTAGSGGYR